MVTRQQLKDFITEIKAKTGLKQFEISKEAGYEPKTLGQLVSKGAGLQEVYDQLNRVFGQRLKNSPTQILEKSFTADQLFSMYMSSAERQDRLMEAQLGILKSIESKMARQDSQAIIENKVKSVEELSQGMASNLKRTLAAALTVAKGQEDAMKEIRSLLSQEQARKKGLSPGDGKGRGRIDGAPEKKGKSSA